jgi:cytidylate kinase
VIDRVVTITGPPGSGKSTAGQLLATRLGLEFRSAGGLFREEAKRHRMDVDDFSRYAEAHEEVDRSLDDRMAEQARPGRVLEGRLVGAFCRRRGTPCFYLVVTAEAEERYKRLATRDGLSLEEATRRTRAREESERERYLRYYGIDLDRETPDLTVDTTSTGAAAVADRLAGFVSAHVPGRPE